MEKERWFKAKRYGFGWYPITWQGWAIVLMYAFSLFASGNYINNHEFSNSDFLMQFFPQFFILTVFLIIICEEKGEKAGWRWGKSKEEMLDVYDEQGQKTDAIAPRAEVHAKGLRHRTVHVFIINSKNEVLLQLRAKSTLNPSLWHLSAGGHISHGQTSLTAAMHETKEEIGLDLPASDFQYIGSAAGKEDPSATLRDNEFSDLYLVQKDVDVSALHKQESEVADVRWFPMQDFRRALEENDPKFMHPMSAPILFNYFDKYISHGTH